MSNTSSPDTFPNWHVSEVLLLSFEKPWWTDTASKDDIFYKNLECSRAAEVLTSLDQGQAGMLLVLYSTEGRQ